MGDPGRRRASVRSLGLRPRDILKRTSVSPSRAQLGSGALSRTRYPGGGLNLLLFIFFLVLEAVDQVTSKDWVS